MNRKNGSLLVLTMVVGAALFFFALAYLALYRGDKAIGQVGEKNVIAEQAAAAGIDDSLYHLKKDAAWKAGFSGAALPHSGATYTVTFDASQSLLPYSTNNLAGASAVTGWSGRPVPPYSAHLVSQGRFHGSLALDEAIISMSALNLRYGTFGNKTITFDNGVTTDSYDSGKGTYDATKQNAGGDIATNSTTAGAVDLKNKVIINGTVTVGPGGSTSVVSGAGSYQALDAAPTALVNVPPAAPTGTSHGDVSVSGSQSLAPGIYDEMTLGNKATVRLQKGTYVFSNIDANGQDSTIVLDSGPVTIYFSGAVTLGQGSIVNASGVPSELVIFGTKTATEFTLGQGSTADFVLYAPTATITLRENNEIFGAVIGNAVEAKQGTAIHYDKALLDFKLSAGSAQVLSRW